MTIDEVVEESEKDIPFYQNSDGGVTLSGGEPLFQWEFSCQILERLKADGIHTAIDTTGYAPWNALEKLLKYTDLVLYDIKHIDSERHKEMTGVSNESILDNLRRTATKAKVWIRIPIIPHYNDSSETIQETAKFISGLQNVEKVSLLPYHEWGKPKYRALGREYLFNEVPPSNSQLQQLKEIIESAGFAVEIGS
jgi:pyruvate formate lyase activating enzyme